MVFLLELCSLDIPHSPLLESFSSLIGLLKSLSSDTGDIFSEVSGQSLNPHTIVEVVTSSSALCGPSLSGSGGLAPAPAACGASDLEHGVPS